MNTEDTLYKDYLMDWLKGQRYAVSSQTIKTMESYARSHIIPALGDLCLSQLDVTVPQQVVSQLKASGLANASVRRTFSIVRCSLTAAEQMELISKSYAALLHIQRKQRKELQVWDVKEVQQFLNLASRDAYTHVAFHLALLTGMRQGEILGLRWLDNMN